MPLITNSFEQARMAHQPKRIRVLFVGESRPANGTFFYNGDSILVRYMCEAFGLSPGADGSCASLLAEFEARGYYLRDLCLDPVNQLPRLAREQARRDGEVMLGARIRNDRPDAIVVVMKAIVPSVRRVLRSEGLEIPLHVLPFPAFGHQRQFVEQLASLLTRLPDDRRNAR